LLTKGSRLVAFVLAVNLSPEPMTPAQVGKRIGITARGTLRKLVAAAKRQQAIAVATIDGRTWVARGGYIFDQVGGVVKNGTAVNGTAVNGTAHVRCKTPTLDERKKLQYGTLAPAARRAPPEEEGSQEGQPPCLGGNAEKTAEALVAAATKAAAAPLPDEITLAPWVNTLRRGEIALELELATDGARLDEAGGVTHASWLAWLARYGEAPAHLKTPAAYREALTLGNEIVAHDPADLMLWQALPGIAFAVMQAVKRGKPIRSLGFIAVKLLRNTTAGDWSWAFDIPSTLAPEIFNVAAVWARYWVPQLEAAQIPLQREALLGTIQVEQLNDYLQRYGANAIAAGLKARLGSRQEWPQAGSVCAWHWFDEAIKAAAAKVVASKASNAGGG
jgi:hypothetical protein